MGVRPSTEAYWSAMLLVLLTTAVGAEAVALRDKVPRGVRLPLGDAMLLAALFSLGAVFWRLSG